MCRNITALRGLEPPATEDEITAAAVQYIRKVTGVTTAQQMRLPAFELAVAAVAEATSEVLASLPPRRQPPTTEPPLRRLHPVPAAGMIDPSTRECGIPISSQP